MQARLDSIGLRLGTASCLLLLACITAVFFHRALLHPGMTLSSLDIVRANSEYKFAQWRGFSEWGRFPLWDPTVFSGKSIVGDSLTGLLNPPQWLFWIIPSTALFGYLMWFYATVGAWGMFLFARRKGCDAHGALLAAVIFTLGGKMAGHLYAGHVEVLGTMLCLPWIMLAAEGVLGKPSFSRAALLGAALALVSTCGSVQFIYWHFLFVGAYALLWLLAGAFRSGGRGMLRPALAFAAGIASFLVFAAPWWFPVVRQTLLLAARARGADYAFSSSISPDYADLLHLVWPFRGIVAPVALEPGMTQDILFWEKTLYFGVVPLALLLPACLWPRKNRSTALILVILMAVTFTLGLGNHGPLFWLATKVIPGFGLFRCPGRLFLYTAFPAALLVGLFLSGGGAAAGKWRVLAVAGTLLAAVVAGALLLPQGGGRPTAHVWLPAIMLALFVLATGLWIRGILPEHLWKSALVLLVCCDLFVIWQDHFLVVATEKIAPKGQVVQYLEDKQQREEFRMLAPDVIDQTRAAKYGLEILNGYHPGVSGRFLDLYQKIWKSDTSDSTTLMNHPLSDVACPIILDLLNVVYVAGAAARPLRPGEPGVQLPDGEGPQVRIFRRPSALPRVCMVPGADVPPAGVPLLDALCSMDPRAGCLVEDRPFHGGDAFRFLPYDRGSSSDLTLDFNSEKGGVVVISQAWHPDWRATDHGKPVELRRVNYDFVGVCVGPGNHELRVWYRPWDFYLGCAVAAAAWTALAGGGAWSLWKRRRPAVA
jgi:hypothetical protein